MFRSLRVKCMMSGVLIQMKKVKKKDWWMLKTQSKTTKRTKANHPTPQKIIEKKTTPNKPGKLDPARQFESKPELDPNFLANLSSKVEPNFPTSVWGIQIFTIRSNSDWFAWPEILFGSSQNRIKFGSIDITRRGEEAMHTIYKLYSKSNFLKKHQ